MKNLKFIISIFVVMSFIITSCSSSKDLRKAERQERQIENTLEDQAHQLAKKLNNENYELCGLGVIESEIFSYLKNKQKSGSICEEAIVTAPTDNIGKTKCLINIKGRVAKIVCDSIRYRVDEATGGDEENSDYVDKFFAATEHLGILNLGSPDYSFTVRKKISKNKTEYKMFSVYSGDHINNIVSNGIKFGNDIKSYIDKGLK